ncbi:hypothetical protein CKO25_09175 [Thiocapsa imhoffii]|uniref:Uncharacterized protein n=1 Tax=Thiocapsa imhoffii TaxID=382777 RepID=A0A9X0WHI3_9GAMM|nr:hypothetical protein [Thiocapsa imhoffii]MBK1644817.1 hypothetical protein [Thiocapsa imhoffii]
MKIGSLVRFNEERFFEGAVQLRWVQERWPRAQQAAGAFVFHGPRYHGAADAEQDGVGRGYRLKDTASVVADLVDSILGGLNGEEHNPYGLAVAGYGTGKSHLATAIACLLGDPRGPTAAQILANLIQADAEIGARLATAMAQLHKPVLVLCLDGMAGFHLGNALVQAVFAQLERYGVDATAIRELSPRFQTAEQFVARNFDIRAESFARHCPGLSGEEIIARLRQNDEAIYEQVDALYLDANGAAIPVVGQESAQELINTLCEVYCGPAGPFASLLILFDEFGRYLEYAAEKPQLAGDAALQQIFQGVQDNAGRVRFIGLIQYELKAYLKRFGSADLRQLQRYITRFDTAEKLYLSTNLETIFAHMIGKDEAMLAQVWEQGAAATAQHTTWLRMSRTLPGFGSLPVWNDPTRFEQVIAKGCWPLHPLATWFLTRQRDVVQSRSALTVIKDVLERIADEEAQVGTRLRQVSAAELVMGNMLSEVIAAEREKGATVAETLQALLEKFATHLAPDESLVLAGVAILEKVRVGKQTREDANALLGEATALDGERLHQGIRRLEDELGALEWNADLGQYELIADASTRGQFQQWLRQRTQGITEDAVRELFIGRAAKDAELGDIATDFAQRRGIATAEWFFAAQLANLKTLGNVVKTAFQDWRQASSPRDARGQVIYLYRHAEDEAAALGETLSELFQTELKRCGVRVAPIWVVTIADPKQVIADALKRLNLFDERMTAEEADRFRRFVSEERARAGAALKTAVQEAIKVRDYWVAGMESVPEGRLKTVGEAILEQVYPQAIPFPFDGFATTAGGGPADAAQLTRSLIARQVDGAWVQAQPKRMQNRVSEVLARSWRALAPNGKLTEPLNPAVKAIFEAVQRAHEEDPQRTLLASYEALMAPPYGLNTASAGLLLALLIAGEHPPRRLQHHGTMMAAADWIGLAFPGQRGKHQFETSVLKGTTVRFLSADSEGRWRELISRWDAEQQYQKLILLAQEAEQMQRVDPMPESLDGTYRYLSDKSSKAAEVLHRFRMDLKEYEEAIEKAERQNNVGELLRNAKHLLRRREEVEDALLWPSSCLEDCEKPLVIVREMVGARIADWIPRQGCQSPADVAAFRQRIDKAVGTLRRLGFETESRVLHEQAQRSILQVEKRQNFKLTLDESDDYPRQPDPTDSTPVRELHDEIARADALIEALKVARSVLREDEVQARVKAIQTRQQRLREMLERQRAGLGALFEQAPRTIDALREMLVAVNRLRDIFVGTRDAAEVSELGLQLRRLADDVAAWESDALPPERVAEILDHQAAEQCRTLMAELSEQEIEPAWELMEIYQALAAERIAVARRRSTDWLSARMTLAETIPSLERDECWCRHQELEAAPGYLAAEDRAAVARLQSLLRERIALLDQQARNARIATWRLGFPDLDAIPALDQHRTETVLRSLRNPPDALSSDERAALAPLVDALAAHFDQMCMDEIRARIERLPAARQQSLLAWLNSRLSASGN